MSTIEKDLISRQLETYLANSRLSMTGLAGKLNISKAQLSLIKNEKKLPSLDLGLKILKYIGTEQSLRKDWALDYIKHNSQEYEELENSVRSEMSKYKLSQNICNRFENNIPLLNIYLDIINAENGISRYVLEKEYGTSSRAMINALVDSSLIESEHDTLRAKDQRSIFTKQSSFNFMKTIFDNQRDQYETGQWDGKFQFVIDDIDEIGRQELEKLLEETMAKANEIVKKSEKTKHKGGKRIVFQVLNGTI